MESHQAGSRLSAPHKHTETQRSNKAAHIKSLRPCSNPWRWALHRRMFVTWNHADFAQTWMSLKLWPCPLLYSYSKVKLSVFPNFFCLENIQLQDLAETDAVFQIPKPCIMEPCRQRAGREGGLYSGCHFIDISKSSQSLEDWAFPAGDIKGSIQQAQQ